MSIYEIPALLYYFPTDINTYMDQPERSPNLPQKGLRFDPNIIDYPGCPDAREMKGLFDAIDEIVRITEESGVIPGRQRLLGSLVIREQRTRMQREFYIKSNGKLPYEMSPLSAVQKVHTRYLLNYLSQYENDSYRIGELLRSRRFTVIYQVNARFRGDPYPGALAAIDYLMCREGKTFEDRRFNLVLLFGELEIDQENETIHVHDRKGSSILHFCNDVKNSERHNLLTRDYRELRNFDIPRYLMQVRYGSTYSKVKHIRVFSYFADAILFPNGSLWRDG